MLKLISVLMFFLVVAYSLSACHDVAITGYVQFFLSIGRVTTGIIDSIKDDLNISVVPTRPHLFNSTDVPIEVYEVTKHIKDTRPLVTLFTDNLSMPSTGDLFEKMPTDGHLKIAYTMVESTKIPPKWTTILNEKFDMAVVPHKWLVPIYKKCGVKIPIFVLPPPLYLSDFYKKAESQKKDKKEFVFGISSGLCENKNVPLLIKAFKKEFEHEKHVKLLLHAPRGNKHLLKKYMYDNQIKINTIRYRWELYTSFISSLDCYVLPSKGEGFSITAYEAIASGVPCILTNNTAHTTLCNKPFVCAVPALKMKQAAVGSYGSGNVGNDFNCKRIDLRRALRKVYEHHRQYKKAAVTQGRDWVMQHFSIKALRKSYITLCKPSKVLLGEANEILPHCLITNSAKLYKKYTELLQKSSSVKD